MFGRVLFLTLLVGGGTLLWIGADDQAERLRGLAEHLPGMAPPPAGEPPPIVGIRTDAPPVTQPPTIRTWTDAGGVTHFVQAGTTLPANATLHQTGQSGTLADYEKALEQQTGLSPADVARAGTREAQKPATAAGTPGESVDPGILAQQQLHALVAQNEQVFQQIRDTNNR